MGGAERVREGKTEKKGRGKVREEKKEKEGHVVEE